MKCVCGEDRPEFMMNRGHGRKAQNLCKKCHNKNTKERGRQNKQIFVDYKGGKCERCGYDRCLNALDFHHINPEEKDPTFEGMRYWSFEKAKKELDKCMLLCSNCHREKHDGLW